MRQLDRNGKVVWRFEIKKPGGAIRIANGHVLIPDRDKELLVEVDRAGRVVRQHKTEGLPWHVQVFP